ncbi:MAG: acyltransferase [Planctomycetota bacterium]|jgi:acetyltransferase-like isoleucine patch superfamily enzyme
MKLKKIVRRFLVPSFLVTIIYYLRFRCVVSPKAEVELSPLLTVGRKTQIGSFCKIKATDGPLTIGSNVSIGTCCFISADKKGVEIGDYSLIGSNVAIIGNDYKYDKLDVPICMQEKTSKGIKIGNNVWIGANTTILDGATIGHNVIISPNSVVSRKVPDNTIIQGNPAKVIFTRR